MTPSLSEEIKKIVYEIEGGSKEYNFYLFASNRFMNESMKSEGEAHNLFKILAFSCHMGFDNKMGGSLEPSRVLSDSSGPSLNSLKDNLNEIKELSELLDDGKVKSRINEVLLELGLRKERYPYIESIICGYLKGEINNEEWHSFQRTYYERSYVLSKTYGKKDYEEEITNRFFNYIDKNYQDETSFTKDVFSLIVKLEIEVPQEIIDSFLKHIDICIKKGGHQKALYCYNQLIHKYSKDINEKTKYQILKAELEIDIGNIKLSSDLNMKHTLARDNYAEALSLLKTTPRNLRTPHVEKLIETLPSRITEQDTESINEMKYFTTKNDIREIINASLECIEKAKNYYELFIMMAYIPPIDKASIYETDKEETSSLLEFIFSNGYRVAADGRKILLNSDSSISKSVSDITSSIVSAISLGEIIPYLDGIKSRYFINRELIRGLVENSPIVPTDRIETITSAIYLGFNYKFHEAIYIVCPQVEFLVRQHLKKNGIDTEFRDVNKQTTEELGLSRLMEIDGCKELLGENLHYSIDFMFSNKAGFNLRNEVAHGLLSDEYLHSTATIYAWWLLFSMVMKSLLQIRTI
jgi:hypothetical protein